MKFLGSIVARSEVPQNAYLIFSRRQRGMCELMDVMLTRRRVFLFAGV
jgi:hypothetical protein